MTDAADVAVVITTFNVRDLLARCLDRLAAAAGRLTLEVVVVDNGFGDDTWPMLQARDDVQAIRGSPELGFGGANNIGAAATTAPLILFLNPDTEPEPESIAEMAGELERRPKAGAAGPRLTLSDGSLDPAGHRSFPRPANALHRFLGSPRLLRRGVAKPYNPDEASPTAVAEIDAVSGACLMVRREAFAAVGGFDPEFFHVRRRPGPAAAARGCRLAHVVRLDGAGLALQAAVVASATAFERGFEFYRSMWRYYAKHSRSTTRGRSAPCRSGSESLSLAAVE